MNLSVQMWCESSLYLEVCDEGSKQASLSSIVRKIPKNWGAEYEILQFLTVEHSLLTLHSTVCLPGLTSWLLGWSMKLWVGSEKNRLAIFHEDELLANTQFEYDKFLLADGFLAS